MYTSGVWIVKKGREDEFARRWQESSDSVSLDFPDVTFRLLRDRENPRRFVSLGEGWRNVEQIEAAREARPRSRTRWRRSGGCSSRARSRRSTSWRRSADVEQRLNVVGTRRRRPRQVESVLRIARLDDRRFAGRRCRLLPGGWAGARALESRPPRRGQRGGRQGGWGGVTLAHNVRSPAEVDAVLADAAAAGATTAAQARDVLGWVLGRLHRPRRASVGGRAQSSLDAHRRRLGRPFAMTPRPRWCTGRNASRAISLVAFASRYACGRRRRARA